MNCICICVLEDGTYSVHMEDKDPAEYGEGQSFQSADELMAALPDMLEGGDMGEPEAPMMEGEAELKMANKAFEGGFKQARGGEGVGY